MIGDGSAAAGGADHGSPGAVRRDGTCSPPPAIAGPTAMTTAAGMRLPQAVCFARDAGQISELVKLCRAHRVPLVTRGRGTGTTGATVPLRGGIVLSMERMRAELSIDPANRLARVSPGYTNQELQQAAAQHGFFWPPDPTSAAVCTHRRQSGLQLGRPAGGQVRHAARKHPRSAGGHRSRRAAQDRRRHHQGRGRLRSDPPADRLRRHPRGDHRGDAETDPTARGQSAPCRRIYRDIHGAAEAVSRIMAQPVTPCALEFMDGTAIEHGARIFRPRACPRMPARC